MYSSDFVDEGDRGLDRANDMRKAAAFGALDGVLLSFAVVAGAAGGLKEGPVCHVGVIGSLRRDLGVLFGIWCGLSMPSMGHLFIKGSFAFFRDGYVRTIR